MVPNFKRFSSSIAKSGSPSRFGCGQVIELWVPIYGGVFVDAWIQRKEVLQAASRGTKAWSFGK